MKLKTVLLRLGQVAIVIAVSYGIVRALAPDLNRISFDDVTRWRPSWGLLALSQLMLVGFFLFHCWLWGSILNRMSEVRADTRAVMRMFFLSGLGRYIPGRLWQIAGLAMLARESGISAVTATASVLVGQFAWLTSGLVFLVLLLPQWGGKAPLIAAVATIALGAGLFLGITSTKLGHDLRAWLTTKSARFGNALLMLDRIAVRDALLWWVGYLFSWLVLGFCFSVLVYSFVPFGVDQIRLVAGTIAASYLFGYVMFFSVNGLGIREAVMLGLLSAVMPESAALVVSVVARLWFTAGELLPIALIPFVNPTRLAAHSKE